MFQWLKNKQTQVVLFSSTAIALYGYDQGMMSLINTNYDYLSTMGISEEDPMVGIIVSVYYLGCAVGAVIASRFGDAYGRRPGVLTCVGTAALGNLIMFIAGWGAVPGLPVMLAGRVIMGLGVGGLDAVVPVYTSELSEDDARGTALAQEFQANILGLNLAFIINIAVTQTLGKYHPWAWRTPIVCMQIFPVLLFSGTTLLPETPRWLVLHEKDEQAKESIAKVFGQDQVDDKIGELKEAHEQEEKDGTVSYADMLIPGRTQFHPTLVGPIMGQVNQALTGYGAVSVYGPQIFELLGFGVTKAEFITMGNYLFYLGMMTFAWILIDSKGRRFLLVRGALWLAVSFAILTVLGGLATNKDKLGIPLLATGIPGIVVLYLATAIFGIGWLVPPWLIPTEIYPSSARAQGSAISVVVWGLANFAVTLLTPILFNNLDHWLFLVFAATNAFAYVTTYLYCPESGNRSFEENQEFFTKAADEGTWNVLKVDGGSFRNLPEKQDEEGEQGNGKKKDNGKSGEREPLLSSSS